MNVDRSKVDFAAGEAKRLEEFFVEVFTLDETVTDEVFVDEVLLAEELETGDR